MLRSDDRLRVVEREVRVQHRAVRHAIEAWQGPPEPRRHDVAAVAVLPDEMLGALAEVLEVVHERMNEWASPFPDTPAAPRSRDRESTGHRRCPLDRPRCSSGRPRGGALAR